MAPFDSTQFRQALGHLPTGVVVVTALDDGEPVGMAVGSFTSVSLEPPLVGFFPTRTSTTWPRIRRVGPFAVNVLAHDQEDVGARFARTGTDRFADLAWTDGRGGVPLLDGAIVQIECDPYSVTEAGDHWFVLGQVADLRVLDRGGPLVFARGKYTRLHD
jgi:3-hydroxy-9,10-secoandrosta-1,3,5(10)-triene-9,17-dione monooxygenase reductase component